MISKLVRTSVSLTLVLGLFASASVALAEVDPNPTLQGTVFHDADQDGILGEGELGIEGVTIELMVGETSKATALTAADGTYLFEDLVADTYIVRETDLAGYISSTPNEVEVIVGEGNPISVVNFGDVMLQELGSLSGFVYDDLNRSRVFDAGDAGLEAVMVQLLDSEGMELAVAMTDINGAYAFEALLPAAYTLVEHDLEGYYSTTPNTLMVTLLAGDALVDLNFGDFVPEDGETTPIDLLLGDYFDVPLLDILDLREFEGMGYGNIAKAYYASQMSGEPISAVLALLETEGGWGNVWKALFGSAGLKGNNLGAIVSGRVEREQERLIDGCALVETSEQAQAVLNSGANQGAVKKLCMMVMESGGDFQALLDALAMRAGGAKWKDIEEALSPEEAAEPELPACKGKEKKDNPDC